MARPLRINYPCAYYHVMNRGNHREDIFVTDNDRKAFLDGLADSCEIYSITDTVTISKSKLVRSLASTTAPSARTGRG